MAVSNSKRQKSSIMAVSIPTRQKLSTPTPPSTPVSVPKRIKLSTMALSNSKPKKLSLTMAVSNSKQQKSSSEDDRISSMSDCVLSHILSFLPTHTCVQTSILSPRWHHIWKDLTVLHLSDEFFKFDDANLIHNMEKRFQHFKKFADFVNNVSLRLPYKIQKTNILCTKSLVDVKECRDSINTWVHSVVGPHLKELNLTLYSIDSYHFELPIALSTCTNLVSLRLVGAIFVDSKWFKKIHLPSLKKLKLDNGYWVMSLINALLSGCPILETLDAYICAEDYDQIRVPPTLKTLNTTVDYGNEPSLQIQALTFDYLNTTQITFGQVSRLQSVVKASLDVFSSLDDPNLTSHLLKLFGALSGIKHLVLSISTTKWLLGCPRDLHFPEFRHLLHLELTLPWFNSNFLLTMLQRCHQLQLLIIKNEKQEQAPLPGWTTQSNVPNCIVSHLTFVQFKGYQGLPDELLFAECILQNGTVLKTMSIADIWVDLSMKYDILKRLSIVPRASKACQLIFD